jgi:hypothetical protein
VTGTINDNNYKGSASGTFVISKASSSTVVTITGGPFTYTGSAQTPATVSVTGVNGLSLTSTATTGGTTTILDGGGGGGGTTIIGGGSGGTTTTGGGGGGTIILDGGGGTTTPAPTATYSNNINAGTATASYSYAGDANHEASSDSKTFVIDKAPSVTTVTITGGPFTYTGSAQTPATISVTGAGGLNLTPTAVYANNTNVGDATASYTFAGDANHTGSSNSKTFTIGKAYQGITWAAPDAIMYGVALSGIQLNASVAGVPGGSAAGALAYTPAAGTVLDAGTQILKVDAAATANYNAASATVNIFVNKANPTITWSKPAAIIFGTALSATQLNAKVSGITNGSATGILSYTPAAGTVLGAGSHVLRVDVAETINYNAASATVHIDVNKKVLLYTAKDISNIQYSDLVPAFDATITGFVNGETLATSGVMGSPSFTSTANLTSIRACLSGPGSYDIQPAVGTLASDNYSFSFEKGRLGIVQEDAIVDYTGNTYFVLPGTTATSIKVSLTAAVMDITAVEPTSDPNAGVITNARVVFHRDSPTGTVLGTATVTLIGADTKVGLASIVATIPVTSNEVAGGGLNINIYAVVENFYKNDFIDGPTTQITIAAPGADFVTGGGYLVNGANASVPFGTLAGTIRKKTNFGFTMKYTKSGAKLKGQCNIIVRSNGKIYQIKSNAINSLVVGTPNKVTGATPAYFNTKANYTDLQVLQLLRQA